MVDWGIACLLAATAGPKSVARTMDAANCAAVLLSLPISYHFLRLYSATGRACRRKWRYIKYTPLPLPFFLPFRQNRLNGFRDVGVENCHFLYLRPVAYITACTTVQAVM